MVPFYYNFAFLMYFVFITIFFNSQYQVTGFSDKNCCINGNNLFAKSIELLSIFKEKIEEIKQI